MYVVINPDLFLAANSYTYLLHGISIWQLSHWHFELIVSKTECLSCILQPNLLPFPQPRLGKATTTSPNASVILTSFSATPFNESPICQV